MRLEFFGLDDYGTYFQVERVVDIFDQYDQSSAPQTISDTIELYNALLFVKRKIFSKAYSDKRRKACEALIP